jgi:hypothetical protein
MKKVVIKTDNPEWNFGLKKGCVCDCVECPPEHGRRYANDVWVYSKERGEPVRLLAGEYEFVTESNED